MKRILTYLRAKPHRRWLALAGLTLLLRLALMPFPGVVEAVYSRGLFVGIRWLLDHTLGYLPFPVVEVAFTALLVWGVFRVVKTLARKGEHIRQKLGRLLRGALAAGSIFVFAFNVLWGFNYQRVPVAQTLGLIIQNPDSVQIDAAFAHATSKMVQARAAIPHATDSTLQANILPTDFETAIRQDLATVLRTDGYPVPSAVRGRLLWPKGLLRYWGPIGIYIPFTGEGTVDGSLHPAQLPATLAHEMGHGYGFADEGTCNFYAWRACTQSANPLFRYSGWLSYWCYVAYEYALRHRLPTRSLRDSLPTGIRSDLAEMDRIRQQYEGAASRFGTQFNNIYLKAQGVKEGTDNYDLMVLLVMAWERNQRSSP